MPLVASSCRSTVQVRAPSPRSPRTGRRVARTHELPVVCPKGGEGGDVLGANGPHNPASSRSIPIDGAPFVDSQALEKYGTSLNRSEQVRIHAGTR